MRYPARGFTLTELVAVIVVAGILAAVMLPRWRGETGFEERALRDETVSALRYAQKSAIAARRRVCASFDSNSQLSFRIAANFGAADCTTGAALIGPNGGALVVSGSGGATYSTFPGVGNGISFDTAGRPSTSMAVAASGLPAALAITVEAETGYVH